MLPECLDDRVGGLDFDDLDFTDAGPSDTDTGRPG
jgi:hypothetical protein